MKTAGYSGTPLAKKLGIKNGFKIKIVNEPDYYFKLFSDLPKDIKQENKPGIPKNFIHYFAKSASALDRDIKALKKEMEPNGMLWVSWPKKSSGIQTDVTENMVRDTALKNGLVDIKVCAVDETWSGLKMVIPVKVR